MSTTLLVDTYDITRGVVAPSRWPAADLGAVRMIPVILVYWRVRCVTNSTGSAPRT